MSAYYNEIDPYAAQWLRNLIAAGHIAPGDVDERSITEVQPDDLRGYTQCHFFAGIGGWSYALRLAGWSDDRPVWTGSCPCQPFSSAGRQRGSDDERHLWPAFFRLISECRPGSVFGEQVAGAAGLAWLDHVCADLEGSGYAAAAADLCAAGIGAPHIRQRLYWVAHSEEVGRRHQRVVAIMGSAAGAQGKGRHQSTLSTHHFGSDDGLADAEMPNNAHSDRAARGSSLESGRSSFAGWMGNSDNSRLEGRSDNDREYSGELPSWQASPWDKPDWLPCSDGKARPTQPGLFPLAHGVSGRVGRLRAYGNAIVPQVAAAFIEAAS